MKLSDHFSLDEFTASDTATRLGIDNVPDAKTTENLRMLANTLEQVRHLLGDSALRISSGYRCLSLNRAIGSSDTSAHVHGYAADFTCPAFGTPLQVAKKIAESAIKFDQIIYEGTWVHLSIDPRYRREALSAHFAGGKASYTKGLA